MFPYVKLHLPEVTIETHPSAPANVFIPNFAGFHLLICGFAGIIKIPPRPGKQCGRGATVMLLKVGFCRL